MERIVKLQGDIKLKDEHPINELPGMRKRLAKMGKSVNIDAGIRENICEGDHAC